MPKLNELGSEDKGCIIWREYFGGNILAGTFWREYFGGNVLAGIFWREYFGGNFWRENFGKKILAGKFWRENFGRKDAIQLLHSLVESLKSQSKNFVCLLILEIEIRH